MKDETGEHRVSKGLLITISGDSLDEIKEKIKVLAIQFGVSRDEIGVVGASDPTPEKRRPGRPPGKKPEAPVIQPAPVAPIIETPTPLAEAPAVVPEPVQESADPAKAVVDALSSLNGVKGIAICREVLAKFDAKKFSDLKPEQYAAFTAACKTAQS